MSKDVCSYAGVDWLKIICLSKDCERYIEWEGRLVWKGVEYMW